MTIREARAEGWKGNNEMKLWKLKQETPWALEMSLDFILIAAEGCGHFNQECAMIWFTP